MVLAAFLFKSCLLPFGGAIGEDMMKLNQFTDIGLRTLIYLTQPERALPFTIRQVAAELLVSSHHLVKVVNFMAKQGWIVTARGHNGGIGLSRSPAEYRLGTVIRTLEERGNNSYQLVNCHSMACPLRSNCNLNTILHGAVNVFTEHLEQYTLADAVRDPQSLGTLIRVHMVNS